MRTLPNRGARAEEFVVVGTGKDAEVRTVASDGRRFVFSARAMPRLKITVQGPVLTEVTGPTMPRSRSAILRPPRPSRGASATRQRRGVGGRRGRAEAWQLMSWGDPDGALLCWAGARLILHASSMSTRYGGFARHPSRRAVT